MLSKSRFCRCIHALSDLIYDIFHQLGMALKMINISSEETIDSFPIPICDCLPSERKYFYGIRVHIVATSEGVPVEYVFLPGGAHDINGLYALDLELPPKSSVYADSAYTDYSIEDALDDCDGINLDPIRKKNSLRYDEPSIHLYKKLARKLIETVFSQIVSWFPKWIHAVTLKGFLLKVSLFILAFTIDKAFL